MSKLSSSSSLLSQSRAREEAESPGKENKSFKAETDASVFLTEMRAMFAKEREVSNKQHDVLVDKFTDMNNRMGVLSVAVDEERTARETELKKVNKRFDEQADTIKELVKEEVAKAMTGSRKDDESSRGRQIIVFGFDSDTDANVIKDTINDFLREGSRRCKVVKVDTFTDPAAIGFIEFESIQAKIGFYKKIKNNEMKLPNGKTLGFDNNEPFEIRKLNKQLGHIKFQINAKTENELKDITIVRKTCVVKIKDEIGVELDGEGCVQYKDSNIEGLVRSDVDD